MTTEYESENWSPTHVIRTRGQRYPVMLTDTGAAYTREEWDSTLGADFELVDGEWLFQGRPLKGIVEPYERPA